MVSLKDLKFIGDGEILRIGNCKVSAIGQRQWIIKVAGCTFYLSNGKKPFLQVVDAKSILEVQILEETIVSGDLSNYIGQTFELKMPSPVKHLIIRSYCGEEGLRIKNIYYTKDGDLVIQTED